MGIKYAKGFGEGLKNLKNLNELTIVIPQYFFEIFNFYI